MLFSHGHFARPALFGNFNDPGRMVWWIVIALVALVFALGLNVLT